MTGEKVRPWEIIVRFSSVDFPQRLVYKYSLLNEINDTIIWEREPSRYLILLDPSNFTGDTICRNLDKAFVVNGIVEKADANFVGGMSFDKIGNTGITIGPYP